MTAVQPARAGLGSEPGDLPGSRRARGRTPRPAGDTLPRPREPQHVSFPPRVDRRAQLQAQLRARVRAQLRARALARSQARADDRPAHNGDRARKRPVAA